MFTTLIIQPIFNLLVLIYAVIPGHNFGLTIIVFTILIRLLMWPLVKKQINHAKAMRELQPELKKIKQAAKGDRQKEAQLTMELYKEKEINPYASLGILLLQFPILIGLYSSVNRIVRDPHQIIDFSYPALHNLHWMQVLQHDIHRFDDSLFGVVNLTKSALGSGGIYWPALLIVAAAAMAQYFQSKQLMPKTEDSRGLRQILSEAGTGKSADQQEVSAAVGRGMIFLIPGSVFLFGLGFPSALPLYWLVSSLAAFVQQAKILKDDAQEADNQPATAAETTLKQKSPNRPKKTSKNKRRKR
jgi:YidC/Oxa1 family membrane protein insertase